MKHKNPPRIAWSHELLMHAQGLPDDAPDWIEWHPFGDVLRIITTAHAAPEVTRAHQTAAAAALNHLAEQKRVTVRRTGRNLDSYRLTKAGRVRALELIEHGGVTAKTAERLAKAGRRATDPKQRMLVAMSQEDPRTGASEFLGSYVVPTLTEMIKGLHARRRELERELFDDDALLEALSERHLDAITRAVKTISELSDVRWRLASACTWLATPTTAPGRNDPCIHPSTSSKPRSTYLSAFGSESIRLFEMGPTLGRGPRTKSSSSS